MYRADNFMMKFILIAAFALIALNSAAQENTEPAGAGKTSETDYSAVSLPVNVYDTFTFSESKSPFIRYSIIIGGPAVMTIYGLATWGWGSFDKFAFQPETYKGPHAVNGAADKYGHAWLNFAGKRFFTFMFRASGSSRLRSNIEGAALMDVTGLICELGDGVSPDYGFDPYDFLFNQFGIFFGMLLDWSPLLDGIFTLKWEYWPSRAMKKEFDKEHFDFATDYSGSKYILTTKLGGIPYISRTPLRYLDVDIGYYTRGYRDSKYYPSRKRAVYLGLSMNFTFAFGDLLPVGFTSSTMQTFFNYYHPAWDLEVKNKIISDRPHDEFQ